MLFEAEFRKGRRLAPKPNRHAFVIRNNGQAMFPDQIPKAHHLIRLTAQIDLTINDTSSVEILTECSAVRTAVRGEDEDGVERDHSSRPDTTEDLEFRIWNFGFPPHPPEPWPRR
jgi:hypothetical protein